MLKTLGWLSRLQQRMCFGCAHATWVPLVWMSLTVAAVVRRERLVLFLAWKLLSVSICPEDSSVCPPLRGWVTHPGAWLRLCAFWLENLSRALEAWSVLARALTSGKSTLRDGGPRLVSVQAA